LRPGQYARRQAGPRSALKEQGLLGESLRGSRGVDFSAAVTAAGSACPACGAPTSPAAASTSWRRGAARLLLSGRRAHDEPEHREEIAADLAAQGLAPRLVIVEAPPEE
jgi:hypothetical protein